MTAIARGQITITEQYDGKRGKDGTDGKDAANVYLSTQMLLVNTDDSGVVEKKDLDGIEAQVLAYRGDERIEAIIVSCQCSPEVVAEAQGDTIDLSAVRTDKKTGMAYGSGYIDIVAEVEGKNYPLRLFVGVNIAKLTASVVSDVRAFRQEFGKYQQTTNGEIKWTKSRIEQTARDITMEVSARSQGVNLLQGTDFLGDLTTSEHHGGGTVNITFGDDPQKAHTGHRYMHVEAKGNTSRTDAGKSWTARVESGKKYTASMWMMTPDKNSIDLDIYLECIAFKGGKDPVWLNHHVTPMAQNNTWYAHSDTFGIPDGYDTLQVFAFVVRNGDVYFSEVQLEEGDTRSAWSPYVGDTEEELRNSGIYLKDRKIRMRADNFEVENNKGERTFVIDKNGKINARLIDADSLITRTLDTKNTGQGSIHAENGVLEVRNPKGVANIRFGLVNGAVVLAYYNDGGRLLYMLGPDGITSESIMEEKFTAEEFVRLNTIQPLPSSIEDIVRNRGLMQALFRRGNNMLGTPTMLYHYQAGKVDNMYVPGLYSSTAENAAMAAGLYFTERGNTSTVGKAVGLFAAGDYSKVLRTDKVPDDYNYYASNYAIPVRFNGLVYRRVIYVFSNGRAMATNVYSNTAEMSNSGRPDIGLPDFSPRH